MAGFSIDAIPVARQYELAEAALVRTVNPDRRYMTAMSVAYLHLVHDGQTAALDYLAEVDRTARPQADVERYARLRNARALLDRTIAAAGPHRGWNRLSWLREPTTYLDKVGGPRGQKPPQPASNPG